MADERSLIGSAISFGLSLLLFYFSRRMLYPIKLARRVPLTLTSQAREGMVQVAGRAMGKAGEKSYVLGLNCLVTHTKFEVYYKNRKKDRWQTEFDSTRSAPFYVEDASGLLCVDPNKAAFELEPDLKMNLGRWWRGPESPRPELAALQWTKAGLVARVREKYFDVMTMKYGPNNLPDWMKRGALKGHRKLSRALEDPEILQQALAVGYQEPATAAEREKIEELYKRGYQTAKNARKARFRVTEQNLLPGHAVYVLGPAFDAPEMGEGAHPLMIRKEHPDDTFVIGEGTVDEVHARIRKESRRWVLIGLAFLAAAAILLHQYYSKAAGS
jgi:hypothetical protein